MSSSWNTPFHRTLFSWTVVVAEVMRHDEVISQLENMQKKVTETFNGQVSLISALIGNFSLILFYNFGRFRKLYYFLSTSISHSNSLIFWIKKFNINWYWLSIQNYHKLNQHWRNRWVTLYCYLPQRNKNEDYMWRPTSQHWKKIT